MLHIFFGIEVAFNIFAQMLFSKVFLTHFYHAIAFHSYNVYIIIPSLEYAWLYSWFCIMIGVFDGLHFYQVN